MLRNQVQQSEQVDKWFRKYGKQHGLKSEAENERQIESLEDRDHYYSECIADGLTPITTWDQASVCPESIGVTTLAELARIANLTKGQRKAVALALRLQKPSLVAKELGLTTSAVCNRLARARVKIKAAFVELDKPAEMQMIARLMDREEDLPSPWAMRLFDWITRTQAKSIYRMRVTRRRRTAYKGSAVTPK